MQSILDTILSDLVTTMSVSLDGSLKKELMRQTSEVSRDLTMDSGSLSEGQLCQPWSQATPIGLTAAGSGMWEDTKGQLWQCQAVNFNRGYRWTREDHPAFFARDVGSSWSDKFAGEWLKDQVNWACDNVKEFKGTGKNYRDWITYFWQCKETNTIPKTVSCWLSDGRAEEDTYHPLVDLNKRLSGRKEQRDALNLACIEVTSWFYKDDLYNWIMLDQEGPQLLARREEQLNILRMRRNHRIILYLGLLITGIMVAVGPFLLHR